MRSPVVSDSRAATQCSVTASITTRHGHTYVPVADCLANFFEKKKILLAFCLFCYIVGSWDCDRKGLAVLRTGPFLRTGAYLGRKSRIQLDVALNSSFSYIRLAKLLLPQINLAVHPSVLVISVSCFDAGARARKGFALFLEACISSQN